MWYGFRTSFWRFSSRGSFVSSNAFCHSTVSLCKVWPFHWCNFSKLQVFLSVDTSPLFSFSDTRKRFLHLRVRYYANSDSCFQQTRPLVSGDVPSNRGPVTNACRCSVCSKTVARNHRAVNYDQCHKWYHIKCGQVKPRDNKVFQNMASFD